MSDVLVLQGRREKIHVNKPKRCKVADRLCILTLNELSSQYLASDINIKKNVLF